MECEQIGEVTGDGRLKYYHHGELVADVEHDNQEEDLLWIAPQVAKNEAANGSEKTREDDIRGGGSQVLDTFLRGLRQISETGKWQTPRTSRRDYVRGQVNVK